MKKRKILVVVLFGVLLLGAFGAYTLREITPGADRRTRKAKILVFEDLDGDGEYSKGEPPIPNTMVVATTNVHGTFTQHAVLTDADGKATIEAEYTHYFDIQALWPCGYIPTSPAVLSATGGSWTSTYEFGFRPDGDESTQITEHNLRFQVWQDLNRDGFHQDQEPPLSDVTLLFAPVLTTSMHPSQPRQAAEFDENELST